jgi:hypothetical protein
MEMIRRRNDMLMDKYNVIPRINACYFGMQSLLDPNSFKVKQQREESASYPYFLLALSQPIRPASDVQLPYPHRTPNQRT